MAQEQNVIVKKTENTDGPKFADPSMAAVSPYFKGGVTSTVRTAVKNTDCSDGCPDRQCDPTLRVSSSLHRRGPRRPSAARLFSINLEQTAK